MIDALIFDLDGTLVDSLPGIEYAAQAAWRAVQPDRPCPPLRPLIGPPIRVMFHRAWPEATTDTLQALERAFRKAYDTGGWQKTTTYPGVIETLARLSSAGHMCLGVTNKPQFATQRILEHCGLKNYFREFFSPDSGEPTFKSKADAVSVLLARYDLIPENTLLTGDSLDDARAAQVCGLRFAAFTGGYGQIEQQTGLPIDLRFECFADLFHFVGSQGA
jgi:phosphoglycolate phosphatase